MSEMMLTWAPASESPVTVCSSINISRQASGVAINLNHRKVDSNGVSILLQQVVIQILQRFFTLLLSQSCNGSIEFGLVVDVPRHLEDVRQRRCVNRG